MGLFDSIKNIMSIPEEEDYEENYNEEVEEAQPKKKGFFDRGEDEEQVKREPARVLGGGKAKTVNFNSNSMQVVLVKPDRFEDVTSIADHLNEKKTVVLNLEAANRETSRRIIDFLSGAAYANSGNMRKVANSTFIIVPHNVDVMGELMLDEFDTTKSYF